MKINRLTTAAGMLWAVACLVMLPVLLLGFPRLEKAVAGLPFMRVCDKFTGGPVQSVLEHDGYRTMVHKPVFQALIGEARTGFVQVKWAPLTNLPEVVREDINFSAGKTPDFSITIDTASGRTELTPLNDNVLQLQSSCAVSDGWVVRVELKRAPARQRQN